MGTFTFYDLPTTFQSAPYYLQDLVATETSLLYGKYIVNVFGRMDFDGKTATEWQVPASLYHGSGNLVSICPGATEDEVWGVLLEGHRLVRLNMKTKLVTTYGDPVALPIPTGPASSTLPISSPRRVRISAGHPWYSGVALNPQGGVDGPMIGRLSEDGALYWIIPGMPLCTPNDLVVFEGKARVSKTQVWACLYNTQPFAMKMAPFLVHLDPEHDRVEVWSNPSTSGLGWCGARRLVADSKRNLFMSFSDANGACVIAKTAGTNDFYRTDVNRLQRPDSLCLSKDETTLYVSDLDARTISVVSVGGFPNAPCWHRFEPEHAVLDVSHRPGKVVPASDMALSARVELVHNTHTLVRSSTKCMKVSGVDPIKPTGLSRRDTLKGTKMFFAEASGNRVGVYKV
jgi:hypothetical protein